jgi:hypothetical protein
MGTGSFLEVKSPRRGVEHPHASSAVVKHRVKQYIYFPLGLRGLLKVEIIKITIIIIIIIIIIINIAGPSGGAV